MTLHYNSIYKEHKRFDAISIIDQRAHFVCDTFDGLFAVTFIDSAPEDP